MKEAIALEGVRAELGGQVVLDGVDLAVAEGAWVAVLGPNGAGKSTLLRIVAGLLAHRGAVRLGGRPVAELGRRERARLVALVPQTPVVPEAIRVTDYVLLGRTPHLRAFGAYGAADLRAAGDALARLDLLALAERPVSTLSGGERQRVLLARALAQAAPVVLLDEPTSALDVGHQQQVLELVDQLRRSAPLTVLSTMHDLTLAGQYADRLVLLDQGRVVAEGTAADVLTEDRLARHYGAHVRVLRDGAATVVVPRRTGL